MKRNIVYAVTCAALTACAASGAIIDDGFESYTSGVSLNGQGGWEITGEDGTTAVAGTQIVEVSTDQASAGSQSIQYFDTSDNATPLWAKKSFSPVTGEVTVRFDYNMWYNQFQNPVFSMVSSNGTQGVLLNLQTVSYNNSGLGQLRYKDGNNAWQVVGDVNHRQWYEVEITISDFSSGTFDLVVTKEDETELANLSGLSMQNAIDDLAEVRFGISNTTANKTTRFYVDNLAVIPEPASLALIGAASMGVLVLRRIFTI